MILLTENILHWFWSSKFLINAALANSVTVTDIFKIQKQSPEVFVKVSQNSQENTYARVSFLIKLQGSALQPYEKRDSLVFSCELCNVFKNTFFASDCFSKYESFYQIAANHIWLSRKCLENIQEHICIGFQLKAGWIHITIKIRYRKTPK